MKNSSGQQEIPEKVIAESVTQQDSFWIETGQDAVKVAEYKLDEASKQIISITIVSQVIYFAAISFSDLKKDLVAQDVHGVMLIAVVTLFVSPIIIWFISFGCAVLVFMPVARHVDLRSPSQLKKMYQESVDHKSKYLKLAHMALVLGFGTLVVSIIIYLIWM